MRSSTVFDCSVISLPRISSSSGSITAINNLKEVPFKIERVYYLYDVPNGQTRGGHAHKDLYQLVVAVSGSFEIIIDDHTSKRKIFLNNPNIGLLVPPGIWRELVNFSSGSVCLVLASLRYSEDDYIRNYDDFIKYKL
jgi:dTDP-4-dehydrorhamnose 3,5-epimerase-like enzyme